MACLLIFYPIDESRRVKVGVGSSNLVRDKLAENRGKFKVYSWDKTLTSINPTLTATFGYHTNLLWTLPPDFRLS